jgi:hypothetical protein
MADDIDRLLRRLIGGDETAGAQILELAGTTSSPALLVAAALVDGQADHLMRASQSAQSTRDRQLVAIATAHLRDEGDLLDALVRDHLSDHPDNVLVAWIAGRPATSG